MINKIKTYLQIDFIFFIKSTLAFIFLVAIGTLSHEMAHVLVARLLAYETCLHFDSMNWFIGDFDAELFAPFSHRLMVSVSGVLQTLATACFGFYLVLKNKENYFWIGVYFSFFASREIFNLSLQLLIPILNQTPFFQGNGDEVLISNLLNLPSGFFSVILGVFALLMCSYIVFVKISKYERFTFILSGVFGSFLGYYIWFVQLGPCLLP